MITLDGPLPVGVPITAAGSGPARIERMVELAQAAEAAGFASLWTNELYSHSATIPMAVLGHRTERAQIASGIAYGVGRSPLTLATEARDLDEVTGGRLLLGIGNGTARMMADWHGVSGESPAVRMEELVDLIRKLWRLHEEPVKHEGRFYRVDLRAVMPMEPPLRERLPIMTAGVNERMIVAAGRVADALCGHPMFTNRYLDEVVSPALATGAADRGRDPSAISIVREVMCVVDDDIEKARAQLAFAIAQYAASRVFVRLFDIHGWSAKRDAIAAAVRTRDPVAIVDAVGDEIVDQIGVTCRPEDLPEQLDRFGVGIDHLVLTPVPWGIGPQQTEQQITTIIAAMSSR